MARGTIDELYHASEALRKKIAEVLLMDEKAERIMLFPEIDNCIGMVLRHGEQNAINSNTMEVKGGYDTGYHYGYEARIGEEDGQDEDSYDEGYNEGYSVGYDEGREEGVEEGLR